MKSKELKKSAKEQLRGKWGMFVFITLICNIILSVYTNIPTPEALIPFLLSIVVIEICIMLPLFYVTQTGLSWTYLDVYDKKAIEFSSIFQTFKNGHFVRVLLVNLLMGIYVFLWTLLFIVPGIIKTYSYSMSEYILRDLPELSAKEAITKSKEIMQGNKWKLFKLQLSFYTFYILPAVLILGSIGYCIWAFNSYPFINLSEDSLGLPFLSIIFVLLAIGISSLYIFCVNLYVYPYYSMAKVNFYRYITSTDDEISKPIISVLDEIEIKE